MNAHDIRALTTFVKRLVQSILPAQAAWVGFVVPGSWNPNDGTCTAINGHTLCLDGDTDEFGRAMKPLEVGPFPLLTHYLGQQAGPVGGERVVMLRTEAGPVFLIHHGPDDSVGAPAGEWWVRHYQRVQSFFKLSNDGATRIGGATKIAALTPKFYVGGEDLQDSLAIERQQDVQKAINDLRAQVQQAIDQLASSVQSGKGVPAPTVGDVTVSGSSTSYTV